MTVHFAAARSRATSPLARVIGNLRTPPPANDEPVERKALIDGATEAALRHFAEHGLGAAGAAIARAEAARCAGDEPGCAYWVDICRRLDSQAAIRFERSHEQLVG